MRIALLLPVLAVALVWPDRVTAWHRDGHFAVARIAWKQLDEGQQLAVARLLKAHPHYACYLAVDRPQQLVSEAEWAFMRASTWADWVRDPSGPGLDAEKRRAVRTQFNKPVWHYVDLPYIHPKDVGKFDADAIRKEILFPPYDERGEPRHVLAALEWCMKQLGGTAAEADRAVALTWLCHLVGDLHQPLHGTSLIAAKETLDPSLDPPGGDYGGNRVVVKTSADSPKAVNLHFYWDAVLFAEEPGVAGVDAMVAKLLRDPKLQREQLEELKATDFLAWAEESLALAKSTVYQGKDGFLGVRSLPAKQRVDLNGFDAPVLPEGYAEAARAAAARRMVVAGYRLADQLEMVYQARKR
jgi:S1/P1 Nuclease